ncbi:AraC family transcriptional regulator [Pseudochryseolinea flava]|uniref:AraC family transcriptional regulator n=1 Tax=Pseudochryseolinea flava TaxID=2059302 RepID=A0A364XW39_9BACT|nr:helix-turn-helix domain-containing protein [Pseudochryseolinea flava]RAV98163.1 AraC family transcriptional regulator [Pseudochryseolinea flava]
MERYPDIGKLFTPLQPSTERTVNGIVYSQVRSAPPLQKYIYSYWEFYTDQPLRQPYSHRIVADGCIALIVDILNPENNFIRGFITSYTEYQFDGSFHYAGVCFYPSAFPVLFGLPASELTNVFEQLNSFLPHVARTFTQLFDTKTNISRTKQTFDDYFIRKMIRGNLAYDARFFNAVDIILKSGGALNVQTDLKTGVSPRHLRRLFDFYVGESPKMFCTVVRFQNIINQRPTAICIREKKIFYEAGYYDQAHFIKEFKRLYGLTPSFALQ